MDVSSSLTGPKEFRIVKRGYDPDEVDAFLDQIALGVAELKRKLAEAGDAAAAAPAPAATPPPPAPAAGGDTVDDIHRALILAQRAADEEVRKATEEAEGIRAEARSAAEEARSSAQVAADEARSSAQTDADEARRAVADEVALRREEGRTGLLTEISELEGIRDSLASDVVVLERHVDEQREVVQAAIGELQSLLDHPEAFRIAVASGVSTAPVLPVDDVVPSVPEAVAPVVEDAAPVVPEVPEVDTAAEDAAIDEASADEGHPGAGSSSDPTDALQAGPPPEPSPVTSDDRRDETSTPVASTGEPDPVVSEPAPVFPERRPPFPERPPAAPASDEASGPEIDLSTGAPDPGGDLDPDPDAGPPTEAMAAVGGSESEDAFLAELRKAMLDDEPLGPREDADLRPLPMEPEEEPGRGRSRFGRRK